MNRTLLVMSVLFFLATVLLASPAQQGVSAAKPKGNAQNPILVGGKEVASHRIGELPILRMTLAPRESFRVAVEGVSLQVTVNPDGLVTSATADSATPPDSRLQAEAAIRGAQYSPFLRDGRAVWVTFEERLGVLPPELQPARNVPFPVVHDSNSVRITLERTGCFGSCPSYRVEIRGNGTVLYDGGDYVAIRGRHRGSITTEKVEQLVDAFRQANYYSLNDEYVWGATDQPTYESSIEIDGRLKKVKDYAGENIGMPLSVSKLEDAIDSLADTGRWTKGNAGTVPALSEENWDFESAEAASTLARVAQYGNADAVRDLVAAGVPLSGGEAAALPEAASRRDVKMLRVLLQAGAAAQDPQARDSALAAAASSGSIEAIRLLLEHGANPNSLDEYGGTVLAHAAASGIPEVVETILAYQQDVNAKNNMVTTALMVVVDAWRGSVEAPPVNRAEVVRLLLQAGADPNAQDEEGNTALIDCSWDADAALLLIKHGADVNARNKRGITPLINASAPEVVRVLLQNGADPTARDADGKTALEWAKQYGWKDKAAILEATSVGRKN